MTRTLLTSAIGLLFLVACDDSGDITGPGANDLELEPNASVLAQSRSVGLAPGPPSATGVITANGWYEGEEIYYILLGEEEGVTQRGENDLYLIGGDRAFQANVAEFIPGEPGYRPHWNVNVVHTAPGVTLADILASPFVSEHYGQEPVLFDDVEDILGAEAAGLVTIETPGIVVLCPIVPEEAAEAPGNTELSEDFPAFPQTF
jgi:hypothetical protein